MRQETGDEREHLSADESDTVVSIVSTYITALSVDKEHKIGVQVLDWKLGETEIVLHVTMSRLASYLHNHLTISRSNR